MVDANYKLNSLSFLLDIYQKEPDVNKLVLFSSRQQFVVLKETQKLNAKYQYTTNIHLKHKDR